MNTLSRIVTGIFLFILLFYNLEPGINTCIFAIVIWLLTYMMPVKKPLDTFYWLLSAAYAVSVFSFAMYGDDISFFALFFSVIVTVIYRQYPQLNLIVYPLIFGINVVTFPFRIFFLRLWIPKSLFSTGWKKWIATGLIPAVFLIIFALVYATGSDLFSGFFKRIFFNIDLVQIILLAIFSFFLLFNLWCLWIPRLVVKLNYELKDDFAKASGKSMIPSFSLFDKKLERKGGEITFILLNVLLLIFIVSLVFANYSIKRA